MAHLFIISVAVAMTLLVAHAYGLHICVPAA